MKTAKDGADAKRKKRKRKKPQFSRLHPPPDMSLEAWQIELRRQFGREQKFKLKNLGGEPIFSDFQIANPQSKSSYRVCIRGEQPGDNFCSCPDYATNTLGTCKHIEFTLAKLRRQSGGKAALQAGFNPDYSEVYLRYGPRREVRLRLAKNYLPALSRLAREFFDDAGVLQTDAFARFEQFLARSADIDPDLRCQEDVLGFVAELRDRERRREIIAQAFPQGIATPALDHLLRVPMYDYQRQGALFAAQAGRCLIGDEMGLGKTAQAIAAVEIMARYFGVDRVLIVCPTSLKHQWEREIVKFAERPAQVIGGLRPRRQQGFATSSFYKITNYDTVHTDLDLIQAWSPDLVILDEAQRIKNWSTRAARSVKRIESPHAIVLTGTPLENRLEELVSIVQFVDPHRLGPTFRFLADHQIRDPETGRVIGYKNLDSIGTTLAPVLIRRRKQQVLQQLPGRLDKHLFVPMTPQQMGHHQENLDIVGRIARKWRRFKFLSEADQRRLMIALQNMRMSCDSTFLLDHETDHGVKADELVTLLAETLENPETKVVIFSQWLRMHEILQRRLKKQKWSFVTFHGGVPGPQRKKLIDRFREDEKCRVFLSTDAGGVGLNLQHASVVINMDLPWNPAVLEQRIGRVHRLGQTQPVRVVNFVSRGTIEEGMLEVLKFKTSLFSGALDGGEKEIFLGGSRLNKFMETVEKATAAIPEATVQDVPDAMETPGGVRAEPGGESETATAAPQGAEPAPIAPPQAAEPAPTAPPPRAAEPAPTAPPPPAGEPAPIDAPPPPEEPGAIPLPPICITPPMGGITGGEQFWNGLLQTGLTLLDQLAAAARPAGGPDGNAAAPGAPHPLIQRDAATGENFLRIPMPNPDTLNRALSAIGGLLERFKR